MKVCKICGKEYSGKNNRDGYCSKSCQRTEHIRALWKTQEYRDKIFMTKMLRKVKADKAHNQFLLIYEQGGSRL